MNEMKHRVEFLLNEIETHEFSAEINVCSDIRCVEKVILSNRKVSELIKLCKENDGSSIAYILERSRYLARISVDMRYESPWDIALATHLIILSIVDTDSAFLAASIVSSAPQTWWAGKISNLLLRHGKVFQEKKIKQVVVSAKVLSSDNWLTTTRIYSYDEGADDSLIPHSVFGLPEWKFSKAKINFHPLIHTGNSPPGDLEISDSYKDERYHGYFLLPFVKKDSESRYCEGF